MLVVLLPVQPPDPGPEQGDSAAGPPPGAPDGSARVAPSVETDEGPQRPSRLGTMHRHGARERVVCHWIQR